MKLTPEQEALKAAALAATPGPWTVCQHLKSIEADLGCTCGYRGTIYGPDNDIPMAICQPGHDAEPEGEEWTGPQNYARPVQIANSQFIAAANPAAILALLAQLEAVPSVPAPTGTAVPDGTLAPSKGSGG